ncbi:hypothetical protein [Streptomyces sp. AS02]|uniref:hypothetical protein n=1 Tax=Streptomyces sp. AS02 TaxID=2938946 RepID=UPI002020EB04|nr:hypothetical protein [Streptomyces sp. AS02]MCL8016282.1 hypothetical protein [Streptomyces sp. AS02]
MHRRGHILKLTAVSVLVVMALTGFSSKGRGHGGSDGDSSGGGGGGCSSSSQDHDSSSSSTSGGGSGSGSSSSSNLQDGSARLVTCATVEKPYATIEVTNPNGVRRSFEVHVVFEDVKDRALSDNTQEFSVPARQTKTVQVPMYNAEKNAAKVATCVLDPEAVLIP